MSIFVNPETEARLRQLAEAAGKDVSEYLSQLVEQVAAKPSLDEALAPLRREFAASGSTDEALVEEISRAQSAYRADLRKRTA